MGVLVSETNADVQCRLTTWREGLVVVWKREAAQKAIQHVTVRTDWHRRARFSLATLCMPGAVQVHCLAESWHTVPGRQATPPPTTPYAHLAADLPSLHTHTHTLIASHTHSPPLIPQAHLVVRLFSCTPSLPFSSPPTPTHHPPLPPRAWPRPFCLRVRAHTPPHTPHHTHCPAPCPRTWSRPLSPTITNSDRCRSLTPFSTSVRMRGSTFFLQKGVAAVVFMRWECGCCGCWWVGAAGPPFSTSVRMRCPTLLPARCWRAGGIVH